jgi:hypothetical protein
VDTRQLFEIPVCPFGGQVVYLPPYEATGAGGTSQLRTASSRIFGWGSSIGQDFECQSQQGIPRQDGRGFAKLRMTTRETSPQVIVVHGWQVVVNKRISMDHFDGARRGDSNASFATARFGGHQNQQRAKSFARGQQTMTDRLSQSYRAVFVELREAVQSRFHTRSHSPSVFDKTSRRHGAHRPINPIGLFVSRSSG